jgi:hypothetical protein
MKKLLLFLVIVLVAAFASAQLEVNVEEIDSKIYPDEQARFNLEIFNNATVEKTLRVYTPDIRWYVDTEPYLSRIGPMDRLRSDLILIPSAWSSSGTQIVKVIIESLNTGESFEVELPVTLKSFDEEGRTYSPSVEMKVKVPEEIMPKDTMVLEVYMRNRNRLDISNMTLYVSSPLFVDERQLTLGPLSEGRERFIFSVDPLTPPSKEMIEVSMYVDGKDVNNERIDINILAYSDLRITEDTTLELFKERREIFLSNDGNVMLIEPYRVPVTFLESFFTSTSVDPDSKSIRQQYLEWQLSLSPGEERTIVVTKNYRPALYIMLIVTVVLIMYFIYRSPAVVNKEAIVIGSSGDGISSMKVLIHIRNRTSEIVEGLSLVDQVPGIATLVEEKTIGIMEPTKVIKHQKKGTLMKWEFEALEPFEERIISYRMKSKITILGGLTLPKAKLKFKTKRGPERTVKSNRSVVSFGL